MVATRVLCISANSAQSERDFLSVGRTITDARSRLCPRKVEDIEIVRWGLGGSRGGVSPLTKLTRRSAHESPDESR